MRSSHMVLAIALSAEILGSCGSEPACDGRRCENDPPGSQAQIEFCESRLSHPACGTLAKALLECIWRQTSCDENGKADLSRIGLCEPERFRQNVCLDENP